MTGSAAPGASSPISASISCIKLPPTVSAAEVANNLNALPFVEYAQPALRPAPPPIYSIPKAADPLPEGDAARASSPNFAPLQTYKGKAPPGIGPIPNVKGSDAKGMSFADVEYDWTLTHEDLRIPSSARPRDRADARSLRRPRAWHGRARHPLEHAEQLRRHRHRARRLRLCRLGELDRARLSCPPAPSASP